MMTKKKTSVKRLFRFSWTLPVVAILLYAFAEPQFRAKEAGPRGKEQVLNISEKKVIKLVGYVMDESGEALPGTSVVIKGGTTGCVTDMDGKFELKVPEDASIVLSFVGMKTIVDSYDEIISATEKEGAFYRKYKMKDEVILIDTDVPPPPPPVSAANEKKDIPPPPPPPTNVKGEKEVFFVVEDMPKYPGGHSALLKYVQKMQKKIAVQKKVTGKAKVSFTVNTKGNVTDIKVVEKDNDGAAKGAFMIAKSMENWTPGKQRGKPVSVKYLLPVEFK